MVSKTKTELKRTIKYLQECNEKYEEKLQKEKEACDSILHAILNEAGIKSPECPICFKKFRKLDLYKKHLNEHREVKNG